MHRSIRSCLHLSGRRATAIGNAPVLAGVVLVTAILSVGATLRITTGHLPFINTR